jgi:carboxylesterase type B
MSGMVLSFARTGKPAANWPSFDVKAPKSMMLGEESKVIDWPNWRALPLLDDTAAAKPAPATATPGRPRD